VEPPKYAMRKGCAAWGGRSTMSSPRRFMLRVNVTVCQGRGDEGFLRRFTTGLL
jgi:hypothetical protein